MISECGRKKTSFYPGSCEFSVKQSWGGKNKKSTNESFWMGVNKNELHSKKRPRELRMINCQDSLHALLRSP